MNGFGYGTAALGDVVMGTVIDATGRTGAVRGGRGRVFGAAATRSPAPRPAARAEGPEDRPSCYDTPCRLRRWPESLATLTLPCEEQDEQPGGSERRHDDR